jgi:hypothetical protein
MSRKVDMSQEDFEKEVEAFEQIALRELESGKETVESLQATLTPDGGQDAYSVGTHNAIMDYICIK